MSRSLDSKIVYGIEIPHDIRDIIEGLPMGEFDEYDAVHSCGLGIEKSYYFSDWMEYKDVRIVLTFEHTYKTREQNEVSFIIAESDNSGVIGFDFEDLNKMKLRFENEFYLLLDKLIEKNSVYAPLKDIKPSFYLAVDYF